MVTITDGNVFLTQEAKCCIAHQLKSGMSHFMHLVYPDLNCWKRIDEFGLTVTDSHGYSGATTTATSSEHSYISTETLAAF